MKKFKFKLQGLLNIRQSMEKEIRYELVEIQSLCHSQEHKIEAVLSKIEDWSLYYSAVMKQGGSAVQLAIIDRHIQGLYRYREQLEISLDVYNRKRESVAEQYKEIKKELKVVEHLKDQRWADYMEEFKKEEEKLADEMATLRYTRSKVVA